MTLRADVFFDAGHVVGTDDDDNEIVEGRWVVMIDAPNGIEVVRIARTPEPLERFARRWAADRGIEIEIVRL